MPTATQVDRKNSDRRQRRLIADSEIFHESVASKLSRLVRGNVLADEGFWTLKQITNLCRCGEADHIRRTCRNCGECETFAYRCSIKWCPRCNWRITKSRLVKIKVWAGKTKQAKHVVTTQRNFPVLTNEKIRANRRAQVALRRSTVFANVKGGCCSTEITNKGDGWHLHNHWLVDARWIDAGELARTWGRLVGQEFGIVKVVDARELNYLKEVSKYVCKGNEIAGWPAEQILEFAAAVYSSRFFTVFGSFHHLRKEISESVQFLEWHEPTRCECGCGNFKFKVQLDYE